MEIILDINFELYFIISDAIWNFLENGRATVSSFCYASKIYLLYLVSLFLS